MEKIYKKAVIKWTAFFIILIYYFFKIIYNNYVNLFWEIFMKDNKLLHIRLLILGIIVGIFAGLFSVFYRHIIHSIEHFIEYIIRVYSGNYSYFFVFLIFLQY